MQRYWTSTFPPQYPWQHQHLWHLTNIFGDVPGKGHWKCVQLKYVFCFEKKLLGIPLTCSQSRQLQLLWESLRMYLSTTWSLPHVNLCKKRQNHIPFCSPSCYFSSWCARKSRRISHFPILQMELWGEALGADTARCHTLCARLPTLPSAGSSLPCPASSAKHSPSP